MAPTSTAPRTTTGRTTSKLGQRHDENLRWREWAGSRSQMNINTRVEETASRHRDDVVRNEFEARAGRTSRAGILMERVLETGYLWHSYGRPDYRQ